jgi:hypothetical protein
VISKKNTSGVENLKKVFKGVESRDNYHDYLTRKATASGSTSGPAQRHLELSAKIIVSVIRKPFSENHGENKVGPWLQWKNQCKAEG